MAAARARLRRFPASRPASGLPLHIKPSHVLASATSSVCLPSRLLQLSGERRAGSGDRTLIQHGQQGMEPATSSSCLQRGQTRRILASPSHASCALRCTALHHPPPTTHHHRRPSPHCHPPSASASSPAPAPFPLLPRLTGCERHLQLGCHVRCLTSGLFAGFPHRLTEDDNYEGYFFEKGTVFVTNIWSVIDTFLCLIML